LLKTFFLDKHQKLLLFLPALLSILCFVNTLGFNFVYDDLFQVIKAAPSLEDWSLSNLKTLFTTDVWTFLTQKLNLSEQNDSLYYRPFFNFFLMINYLYAGLNPMAWHMTSVFLHALSSLLAYKVILSSLKQLNLTKTEPELSWLALISSSIFAIHPAQSESVAWISAYVNALLAILLFASLLSYFYAKNNKNNKKAFTLGILASVFFYSLALLTKETALTLALLLFFYEVLLLDRETPLLKRLTNDVLMGLPFFLATLAYFGLRIKIVGAVNPGVLSPDFPEITNISISVLFFTLPTIILTYLKNLILPFSLFPLYPIKYIHQASWETFYFPLVIIFLLVSVAIFLSRNNLTIRLGFIWLLIPFLPVLDIRAFKPEDLMHDRYLYFPLVGAGILLGEAFEQLNKFLLKGSQENKSPSSLSLQPSLIFVIGIYFALLMATTIKQNYVWANEWQLWVASKQGFPESCMANKELGRLSAIEKLDSQAIDYYEQAKLTCPNSADVYLQLGGLYGRTGNLEKAEKEFTKLITLAPYPFLQAEGHFNLGLVYQLKKDKDKAIFHYQKSLEFEPNLEKASKALKNLTIQNSD
jgi:tetratricopeptide (TPR) repeat protein